MQIEFMNRDVVHRLSIFRVTEMSDYLFIWTNVSELTLTSGSGTATSIARELVNERGVNNITQYLLNVKVT